MVMVSMDGPFLDPFHLTNPCCCCCGTVPIANGVRTVAITSMIIAAIYGMMGIWFAFNALIPADTNNLFIKEGLKAGAEISTYNNHNLIEILLICAITSLISGIMRFLSSLFLLRSIEKETKAPAKVWVVIHYCLIIIVTAIVLGASQKNDTLFKSYSIKAFLIFAGVDFFCLLYFLWVIIVYVKEAVDMPGL
ncbi:uncharacterized protein LOC110847612 [Folsomia candida]|uniref:Uncharacterized protein n=1 Tax=Folsomia candida TaxID=158441 RepID=A0A226EHH7_FOLCA|nr:uncharacterized protein LOC110847612 [Folsomia candida]OXA56770.1 hypothetical protein Fcan01_08339 [Folsomia candida]